MFVVLDREWCWDQDRSGALVAVSYSSCLVVTQKSTLSHALGTSAMKLLVSNGKEGVPGVHSVKSNVVL